MRLKSLTSLIKSNLVELFRSTGKRPWTEKNFRNFLHDKFSLTDDIILDRWPEPDFKVGNVQFLEVKLSLQDLQLF